MTNKEIQELDTLIEDTNDERLIIMYKRLRKTYNKYYIDSNVRLGSKDVLLKEQEKEIRKLKNKIAAHDKIVWDLKDENIALRNKVNRLKTRIQNLERREKWQ